MKDKFRKFLKSNGYLPLSLWNSFKLEHGIENKEISEFMKSVVGTNSGLYIYKKNNRILYVGKAKSLFDRVKSHLRESYEKVPGDTKYNTWHKFFSSRRNKGLVKIFWKEVSEESSRQILEKMLSEVLSPEFEKFRKQLEKQSRPNPPK